LNKRSCGIRQDSFWREAYELNVLFQQLLALDFDKTKHHQETQQSDNRPGDKHRKIAEFFNNHAIAGRSYTGTEISDKIHNTADGSYVAGIHKVDGIDGEERSIDNRSSGIDEAQCQHGNNGRNTGNAHDNGEENAGSKAVNGDFMLLIFA